jgi:hypothetical protein
MGIIGGMSFDFDAAVSAPFRMQPGLRRVAPDSPQLTPAAPGSRHQREKLAVLSAFADEALLAEPGFDAAPALAALARHAAGEQPGHFEWDGQRASALGVEVCNGEVLRQCTGSFGLGDEVSRCLLGLAPAWRLAGLLSLAFEEDFAIIDAAQGSTGSLPWLAVALPSHWAPADKLGRAFDEAHAPVADNALLMQAAPSLVRLVTGAERWERFVWTVTPHPRLHAHPARVDPGRWHARFDPAQAWWRTERQSFIPLPERRQAVFTIGVQVQPLMRAIDAAKAKRLHAAIASMSGAVLDYRGLVAVREPLLHWLARRGYHADTDTDADANADASAVASPRSHASPGP